MSHLSSNGTTLPLSHSKPRQSHDGVSDPLTSHIFVKPSDSGVIERLQLIEEQQAALGEELPPMEEPLEGLRRFMYRETGNEDKEVARLAERSFDCEPLHSRKIAICNAILVALTARLNTEPEVLRKWEESRLSARLMERTPTDEVPVFFTKQHIPALVKIGVLLAVFCFALIAELANVVYLVTNAGLGFEGSVFGAVCFGAIYVIGPFVLAEFISHDLSVQGKCRWVLNIKLVATPLVIIGTLIFVWKMGAMNENYNSFAASSLQPWQPPLWLALLVSMLLLAFTVMVIPQLLESPTSRLWPQTMQDGMVYQKASRQVIAINDALAEAEALRVRIEHILKSIDIEREEFVLRCLASYGLLREEANVRVATARIEVPN